MSFSKYIEQEQRESSFLWVPFGASVRSLLKGWEARGPLLSMCEGVWPPDVDTADRVSSLNIFLPEEVACPCRLHMQTGGQQGLNHRAALPLEATGTPQYQGLGTPSFQ